MTREEAEALAAKREKHKSKHMTNARWSAAHDSVKGWHVALVTVCDKPAPQVTHGVSLETVAIAVALFGPVATVRALGKIADRNRK